MWEFFRCATQIDKDSYQVLSSKNETVKAMDKFLISFSLKDNGAEYTMTLRGSGFEYEEIPITINEYNSFMDFKNREFPLEQNRRLYACDILQKIQYKSILPLRPDRVGCAELCFLVISIILYLSSQFDNLYSKKSNFVISQINRRVKFDGKQKMPL